MNKSDHPLFPGEDRGILKGVSLCWLYPEFLTVPVLIGYIFGSGGLLHMSIPAREILRSVAVGLLLGVPVMALLKRVLRVKANQSAVLVLREIQRAARRLIPRGSWFVMGEISGLCIILGMVIMKIIEMYARREHFSTVPACMIVGVLPLAIYPEMKVVLSIVRSRIEVAKAQD